ncbi:MAG: Tetracycline resistance protein, class B [Opitutia bacterium UBA7350]|nr:MAG: Tetracycline resistance protein, class B [Opitutae bacterium UBA7350]
MDRKPKNPSAVAGARTLQLVFLTLFLDLVGFSIIFPLFPAMLDYYLPLGSGENTLLGKCIAPIAAWAEASGAANPRFLTAVFFGGALGSLYSILQFISAPIWGAYSDRIGRRRILLITIAGLALSYGAWALAANFWLLVLARVLGGIMGGNLSVATAAVADITSKEKRTAGMAVVGVAFGLGFIVGPAIGGFCVGFDLTRSFPALATMGFNPFSTPALVACALAVLNFIWVARAFPETLPPEKRQAVTPKFLLLPQSGNGARTVSLVYLLFMLAFSGMEFTLTFLAVERFAFTPMQNGGIFVFVGLVMILVQGGLVRRLSGKVPEKSLALAGLASGVIAFAALAYAPALALFFAALAIMALSIGLVSPSLSALISLYTPETDQGRAIGSFRSAGSFARALGPLLAAILYFNYGSQSAYLLGGLLIVLPLALALRLPTPETRET